MYAVGLHLPVFFAGPRSVRPDPFRKLRNTVSHTAKKLEKMIARMRRHAAAAGMPRFSSSGLRDVITESQVQGEIRSMLVSSFASPLATGRCCCASPRPGVCAQDRAKSGAGPGVFARSCGLPSIPPFGYERKPFSDNSAFPLTETTISSSRRLRCTVNRDAWAGRTSFYRAIPGSGAMRGFKYLPFGNERARLHGQVFLAVAAGPRSSGSLFRRVASPINSAGELPGLVRRMPARRPAGSFVSVRDESLSGHASSGGPRGCCRRLENTESCGRLSTEIYGGAARNVPSRGADQHASLA